MMHRTHNRATAIRRPAVVRARVQLGTFPTAVDATAAYGIPGVNLDKPVAAAGHTAVATTRWGAPPH